MNIADWLQLGMLLSAVIGGLWYINRLAMNNAINEKRVRELEREVDKRDDEIEYLKKRIDDKNDAILKLK